MPVVLFLTPHDPHVRYLVGISLPAYVLYDGKTCTLMVSPLEEGTVRSIVFSQRRARRTLPFSLTIVPYEKRTMLRRLLRAVPPPIHINERHITAEELSLCERTRTVPVGGDLLRTRMVKCAQERTFLRRAAALSRRIIREVGESITSHDTEQDVARQLLATTYELGAEPAFPPIVAFDEHTTFPHAVPTKKTCRTIALIDYGVSVNGYCADITRTFLKDPALECHVSFIRDLFEEVVAKMTPGVSARTIDAYAKGRIRTRGYTMPHAIGHGIGLEVHEFPSFRESLPLVADSIVAIEPAMYGVSYKGRTYGIRYEDDVWITPSGARVL